MEKERKQGNFGNISKTIRNTAAATLLLVSSTYGRNVDTNVSSMVRNHDSNMSAIVKKTTDTPLNTPTTIDVKVQKNTDKTDIPLVAILRDDTKENGNATPSVLDLTASPTDLNFPNTVIGSKSIIDVTLTNTGSSTITITSHTQAGSGFSESGLATSIAAGKTSTFKELFSPSTVGIEVQGSLEIFSTAVNSPTTISMDGNAVNSYSVALSWDASSTTSCTVDYNILRANQVQGPFTQINTNPISGTTYNDTTVVADGVYYYVAQSTCVINGTTQESSYSIPPVEVTIPFP